MKKSILVLSLLLPTLAHSGTTDKPATTDDNKPAVTSTATTPATTDPVKTDPSKTDIVAGPTTSSTATTPATTTATTPAATTPAVTTPVVAKVEHTLVPLSSADLKDAKVSFDLVDGSFKLSSPSFSKICGDKLSISDVTISGATRGTDEDDKNIEIKKPDDLKDYATQARAQITYEADEQNPTLKACLANAANSDKVALSITRTALLNPESDLAIAGIDGEPLTLKSRKYNEIVANLSSINCVHCNDTWKKLSAHLSAAKDSPYLATLITSIFDSALIDMDKKIEDAKGLSDLTKAADQLASMSDFIKTDDERGLQVTLLEKIAAKGRELNSNHGKKITDSVASKTADFERDIYNKIAGLSGLEDDKREEYRTLAADLGKGKPGRLQFLSSIDPNNHEIRDHLRDTAKQDKELNLEIQDKTVQMQRNCMGMMARYNFSLCGELQNDIRDLQAQDAQLKTQDAQLAANYVPAYNDNLNNMFATWQKDGVSYDHSFFASLIQPVKAMTWGNTSQNLPQVYNPRDPQYANLTSTYSNFNGSQYFQNTNTQGSLDAFTNAQLQQGTSRPASYRPY